MERANPDGGHSGGGELHEREDDEQ